MEVLLTLKIAYGILKFIKGAFGFVLAIKRKKNEARYVLSFWQEPCGFINSTRGLLRWLKGLAYSLLLMG